MGWGKREAVSNLVILGEDEGQKRKAGGLLAAIKPDQGYPDKMNYDLVQKDGEVHTLSGSASLARQINDRDIGKFIKCEFTGWGKSANGKFKMIEVFVWEEEPTPDMKKWPQWSELNAPKKQNGNGAPAKAATKGDDFDDFSDRTPPADDDDLPF